MALAWPPPAAGDQRANLTRQMDQHICRMNRMYQECVERSSGAGRAVDHGSEAFPQPRSALSGIAPLQCEAIQAQIRRYHAECIAATAGDPSYAIDCEVYQRTHWPPGAC